MVVGKGRSAAPPGLGNILFGVVRAINMPLPRSWPTEAACGLLLGASPEPAPSFPSPSALQGGEGREAPGSF